MGIRYRNGKRTGKTEIDRNELSDESVERLAKAIENNNGDKFRRHVFEILTGRTVEEVING